MQGKWEKRNPLWNAIAKQMDVGRRRLIVSLASVSVSSLPSFQWNNWQSTQNKNHPELEEVPAQAGRTCQAMRCQIKAGNDLDRLSEVNKMKSKRTKTKVMHWVPIPYSAKY